MTEMKSNRKSHISTLETKQCHEPKAPFPQPKEIKRSPEKSNK